MNREQKKKYDLRNSATTKLGIAVAKGIIIKGPCCICGTTKNVEGHHTNYDEPLNIIWLCNYHHKRFHHGKTMNDWFTEIFVECFYRLIEKKIFTNILNARLAFNIPILQFRGMALSRTSIKTNQWLYFIRSIKVLDKHEYQWVVKKLLGDL